MTIINIHIVHFLKELKQCPYLPTFLEVSCLKRFLGNECLAMSLRERQTIEISWSCNFSSWTSLGDVCEEEYPSMFWKCTGVWTILKVIVYGTLEIYYCTHWHMQLGIIIYTYTDAIKSIVSTVNIYNCQ